MAITLTAKTIRQKLQDIGFSSDQREHVAEVIEDLVTELNAQEAAALTVPRAAGATGTGGFYATSQETNGGIVTTRILIDITGLGSSTTAGDIIGVGANPAHIGQVPSDLGTVLAGSVTCLEAPATGVTDIDFWAATEATGVFDADGAATLAETVLVDSGAAWTTGRTQGMAIVPAAGKYLYLINGAAGTVGTYTAGKFLITLYSAA